VRGVLAGAEHGGGAVGWVDDRGPQAAPGRAATARGPAQGRPAVCAHGGGMAAAAAQLWPGEGGAGREGKRGRRDGGGHGRAHHGLNRAEVDRRTEIDGGAELRRGATMAAGDAGALEVDSARCWLEQARERVEEAKGEAREALARRIEARRRVWPTGTPAMALSSSLARRKRVEGKGMAKTSTTSCG
jgi:hypothetical protein